MNPAQSAASIGRARRQRTSVRGTGIGADSTRLTYKAVGGEVVTDSDGIGTWARYYVPGYTTNQLYACAGTNVVSCYSDAKFNPGTTARWVPSVGFTTPGRVFVAYTTNPEIMHTFGALTTNASRLAFVRGFGNVESWPIYEDHQITIPTALRRKLFDINETSPGGVDALDRSCQVLMMVAIAGGPTSASVGAFEFTDNVTLSGLANVDATT